MSKPRIIGDLVIVAYKAKDLPEREIVGKQDPFVVFRIGETIKKTKTDLGGGQRPTWDDQVNLPIPEKKNKVIVQVYDEDAQRQELISECELDITKVIEDGEEDNWYELHYKGRPAGEIYLEMTFYSAKPPPRRQPTRYGMSKQHPRPTGFANRPPLPQQQQPSHYYNSPYPPQPTSVRPVAPTPVESHSTPTHYPSPYPPQQQQQRPQYNMTPHTTPYPPPVPTPSMSTGSQHMYPQHQQPRPIPPNNNSRPNSYQSPPGQSSRPSSYQGPPSQSSRPTSYQGPPGHTSRPTSPPNTGSYGNNNPASLLSSSYNPASASDSGRPNYGGGGYPPQNSSGGYSDFNTGGNSPYPQSQHFGGFPEPQQFSGGFIPHADPLGTPFAAHQGSFPQHDNGYPPNNSYPPQQGYPPNNGANYPPQQHGYPPY